MSQESTAPKTKKSLLYELDLVLNPRTPTAEYFFKGKNQRKKVVVEIMRIMQELDDPNDIISAFKAINGKEFMHAALFSQYKGHKIQGEGGEETIVADTKKTSHFMQLLGEFCRLRHQLCSRPSSITSTDLKKKTHEQVDGTALRLGEEVRIILEKIDDILRKSYGEMLIYSAQRDFGPGDKNYRLKIGLQPKHFLLDKDKKEKREPQAGPSEKDIGPYKSC